MSYNATIIKIIEIHDLVIPLSALLIEGSDWSPAVDKSDHDITTFSFAERSMIQGRILGGEFLHVSDFACTDDSSGSCWNDVFEPAFKESTGKLVAVVAWEGGDSIQTLTVDGEKITWEDYDFGAAWKPKP